RARSPQSPRRPPQPEPSGSRGAPPSSAALAARRCRPPSRAAWGTWSPLGAQPRPAGGSGPPVQDHVSLPPSSSLPPVDPPKPFGFGRAREVNPGRAPRIVPRMEHVSSIVDRVMREILARSGRDSGALAVAVDQPVDLCAREIEVMRERVPDLGVSPITVERHRHLLWVQTVRL